MNSFKKDIFKTETTGIIFAPFDHMVVNFTYTKPEDGSDLDIMVYYDNTGTIYDQDAVGFGQVPNNVKIPTNATPDADAYLWWANDDNTLPPGPCVEAVVIGIKNFTDNVPVVSDTIEIFLRAGWYSALGNGDVLVTLQTYLGGYMEKNYAQVATMSGTGTLGFVINGVNYTQAFITDIESTISQFLINNGPAITAATGATMVGTTNLITFSHSSVGFPTITELAGGMTVVMGPVGPGTNIVNVGGVLVDNQSKTVNVESCCSQVTIIHSNLLGVVHYDKINKTASLT